MTLAAIRPGYDARDSLIADMLENGERPSRIIEVGHWRRSWTADDVARVQAGRTRPTAPAAAGVPVGATRWTPPLDDRPTREVVISDALADVLTGLCEGLTSDQVAHRLRKSTHTVKTQARDLFAQLGARSRGDLVALACSGQVRIWVTDRPRPR